jgi:nitrate reductase cytochrome c-type subunit
MKYKVPWRLLVRWGTGLCLVALVGPAQPGRAEPGWVAISMEDRASGVGGLTSGVRPWEETPAGPTARRAFAGAPPVMPHSFAGDRDGRYCLECHAREDRVEKRQRAIAPVPHAEFTQCQQCHVNGSRHGVPEFQPSDFEGLEGWGKGDRAHPFAPPTVPHSLQTRENCLACHGPTGRQRIATPHPWRSQCLQCHVSRADRNPAAPVVAREGVRVPHEER